MRTKVLLGLAALAASAIGASASNVYSLNVVGYINIPLTNGFNCVGNQLDKDGTGLNNTVAGVFSSNLPLNTKVYTWSGTGWGNVSTYSPKTTPPSWQNDKPLNPGAAAFVQIPAGTYAPGNSGTVTTVGNVLQGHLVNAYINPAGGYNPVASQVPLSGGLQSVLQYAPQFGDKVYQFNGFLQQWNVKQYTQKAGGWGAGGEPVVAIAEGVFLQATNGPSPAGWTQNFTVQ